MPKKEKEKWNKVLVVDMISSEESNSDDDDLITTKPLPWRSPRVGTFFRQLDEKAYDTKSRQAKRQRKKRVLGHVDSERSMPSGFPEWTLCRDIG